MALLVRSWNVFHGNAVPPEGRAYLREMVALATADAPDVVCLQELPVWALGRLERWSGMQVVAAVAQAPRLGPLPLTAELGRRLTDLHTGFVRSAFSGQANAILVARGHRVLDTHELVLNEARFRRAQARWLRLPLVARLAWAKERRVAHAARLVLAGDASVLVANLHATAYRPDARLADAELLRAAVWADALAGPAEPVVLAGDFNRQLDRSWTLRELLGDTWGFTGTGGPSVDFVLARGLPLGGAAVWPPARRRVGGRLLSDHAPVDAVVG
ncbi:MAG TPA: endonuclease/exonuclease/phosphatase family protein [Gaiellaceae bacterium]|nr:endonuclease/exonuclease/phosphatase family protein [Gaiellaceae bacterium]